MVNANGAQTSIHFHFSYTCYFSCETKRTMSIHTYLLHLCEDIRLSQVLTLKVLVTTIDALRHFQTG